MVNIPSDYTVVLCVLRFGGGAAAEATGEVDGEEEEGEKEDKAAANYGLSGKLTAETNTFKVSSTLMCIHLSLDTCS